LLFGPGEKLRKKREAKGLSQEHVAKRLNLHIKMIRAMEDDNFDVLPEPAFVHGYLKKYAAVLGTPAQPLIEAYDRLGFSAPELIPIHREKSSPNRMDLMFRHTSISMVAIFGFLMLLWWYSFEPSLEQPAVVAEGVTGLAEIAMVDADNNINANGEVRIMRNDLMTSLADDKEIDEINRINKENPPAAVGPVKSILVLTFSGDSWVDISDANGNRLVYDLLREGRTKILRGKPPFEIYLGNASVVKMQFNGEPFNLEPYVNGNLARFKLGSDAVAQKIDG